VYAASVDDVSHVWVDGKGRVKNRAPVDLDMEVLKALITTWFDKISERRSY
jgi:hypothetical protein